MSNVNLNATIKTRDFGKATKETQWALVPTQGDLIDVRTQDGISDDFVYFIDLINFFTLRTYRLDRAIIGTMVEVDPDSGEMAYMNSRTRAENLIEKMKEKGQIDLQYWKEIQ